MWFRVALAPCPPTHELRLTNRRRPIRRLRWERRLTHRAAPCLQRSLHAQAQLRRKPAALIGLRSLPGAMHPRNYDPRGVHVPQPRNRSPPSTTLLGLFATPCIDTDALPTPGRLHQDHQLLCFSIVNLQGDKRCPAYRIRTGCRRWPATRRTNVRDLLPPVHQLL